MSQVKFARSARQESGLGKKEKGRLRSRSNQGKQRTGEIWTVKPREEHLQPEQGLRHDSQVGVGELSLGDFGALVPELLV